MTVKTVKTVLEQNQKDNGLNLKLLHFSRFFKKYQVRLPRESSKPEGLHLNSVEKRGEVAIEAYGYLRIFVQQLIPTLPALPTRPAFRLLLLRARPGPDLSTWAAQTLKFAGSSSRSTLRDAFGMQTGQRTYVNVTMATRNKLKKAPRVDATSQTKAPVVSLQEVGGGGDAQDQQLRRPAWRETCAPGTGSRRGGPKRCSPQAHARAILWEEGRRCLQAPQAVGERHQPQRQQGHGGVLEELKARFSAFKLSSLSTSDDDGAPAVG
ncbi:hypothetical protein C8J57DRAFT_1212003 [Mycena rebaudengoi]|nr:hypothetical protein C8J57DRAFT_1212003 [Mycena rebaudengoi]